MQGELCDNGEYRTEERSPECDSQGITQFKCINNAVHKAAGRAVPVFAWYNSSRMENDHWVNGAAGRNTLQRLPLPVAGNPAAL